MKKNLKKIISLLFAGVLSVSMFAGCGGGGGTGAGGREIYPGGDGMDDGKLTIFRWNFSGVNAARKSNTTIYRTLKDVAGMNLYASTAGAADWKTKLNTMFATQMLPDIFVSMGPETPEVYNDMIDDGVLICVSDFVSETEYPNIYNQLQEYDFLAKNVYYSNGKHYGIPVSHTLEHTMYIRLDWLANLNEPSKLRTIIADEQNISESAVTADMLEEWKFTEPKDLLEFYRVCRAFTLYDPDGNGKNDTYGYTSAGGEGLFADSWAFVAYDAGYDYMVDPDGDGQYEASWTADNTQKAVSYLNDLYKSGYVDPSWYENSLDEKQDAFAKGKAGMMEAHAWYNTIVSSYISANTTASSKPSIEEASERIGMFAPPAGPNGTYGIPGNPNFWTLTCLNAGMSDEELTAALKLIDYMLSEEGNNLLIYGKEGEHFDYDSDGNRVSKMGKQSNGFNTTLSDEDGCAQIASVTNWSTDYLSPYQTNSDKILKVMNDAKSYVQYADYPFLQTKSSITYSGILKDYAEQEVFKMVCDSSIWTGAKTFANGWKIPTAFTEIGVPSSALTGKFATFKSSYNSQGGTKVQNEHNAALANAVKVK